MNHAQRKYALGRIDLIENDLISKVRAKHTVEGKSPSLEERWKLVHEGKVTLKNPNEVHVRYAFDFSEFEYPPRLTEVGHELISKVKKETEKTRDLVMLGDAQEALQMLETLQNIEV